MRPWEWFFSWDGNTVVIAYEFCLYWQRVKSIYIRTRSSWACILISPFLSSFVNSKTFLLKWSAWYFVKLGLEVIWQIISFFSNSTFVSKFVYNQFMRPWFSSTWLYILIPSFLFFLWWFLDWTMGFYSTLEMGFLLGGMLRIFGAIEY